MKQISQEEMKPVSELFASLWALMKQNHHPESDGDWKRLLEDARSIPAGEGPLNKLGVGMVTCIMDYIAEINQERED